MRVFFTHVCDVWFCYSRMCGLCTLVRNDFLVFKMSMDGCSNLDDLIIVLDDLIVVMCLWMKW